MVLSVVAYSRAVRPTPESVARLIASQPLEGAEPEERRSAIDRVAQAINRLDFEERQELRSRLEDRRFFEQLDEEEQLYFLDRTLPEGFRQMMQALNAMPPERREKLVRRALEDIERDAPEIADRFDDERVRKILTQGLDSFYEEANAEVKLDFAPVIERLQIETQGLR